MAITEHTLAALTAKRDGKPAPKKAGRIPHRRVTLDGYTFDSKAEADRYTELRLLAKTARVQGLIVHPKYGLAVNGRIIGSYTADFAYWSATDTIPMYEWVVEDVKSRWTRKSNWYQRQKKLMLACHGIHVTEIIR